MFKMFLFLNIFFIILQKGLLLPTREEKVWSLSILLFDDNNRRRRNATFYHHTSIIRIWIFNSPEAVGSRFFLRFVAHITPGSANCQRYRTDGEFHFRVESVSSHIQSQTVRRKCVNDESGIKQDVLVSNLHTQCVCECGVLTGKSVINFCHVIISPREWQRFTWYLSHKKLLKLMECSMSMYYSSTARIRRWKQLLHILERWDSCKY